LFEGGEGRGGEEREREGAGSLWPLPKGLPYFYLFLTLILGYNTCLQDRVNILRKRSFPFDICTAEQEKILNKFIMQRKIMN